MAEQDDFDKDANIEELENDDIDPNLVAEEEVDMQEVVADIDELLEEEGDDDDDESGMDEEEEVSFDDTGDFLEEDDTDFIPGVDPTAFDDEL